MKQTTSSAVRYSIIIPALNEAQFIGSTLESLRAFLELQSWAGTTEVIVVAANGTDDTATIAKQHSASFAHCKVIEPGPKVGKGRDVRQGMLAATGMYRLFMDADLATPLHHLVRAFDELEKGADVVIGERDLLKVHKTIKRRMVSKVGNALIRMMLGLKYRDSQCGFKGFSAQAADLLFNKQTITGWGFDIELLTIAREHGLRVATLSVPDWSDPKLDSPLAGESALSAARKTFSELQIIRKKWKSGSYA